jgi:hypothetical protein
MATRTGFVAEIEAFSPQNGDEIEPRRQKIEFSTTKRRRD